MYNEVDIRLPREEMMADERTTFVRRTYANLAGAILAFIALEAFLLTQVFTSLDDVIAIAGGRSAFGPLLVMLAFMGATMLAQTLPRVRKARSACNTWASVCASWLMKR